MKSEFIWNFKNDLRVGGGLQMSNKNLSSNIQSLNLLIHLF